AEKARQYKAIDDQLRGLELTLLAMDYQERHERLGKLANDEHVVKADIEGTRSRLNLADAEIERIAAALHELEAKLSDARERARVAEREADQTERAHAVTVEKLRATRERLAELERGEGGDDDRDRQLVESLEQLRAQQAQDRERAEEMAGRLQALREEIEQAEREVRERAQRRRAMEEEHARALREAEGGEREAGALVSIEDELRERVDRLAAQRDEMGRRHESARQQLQAVQAERDRLGAEIAEARDKLQRHTRLHEALTRTLRDHRAKRAILAGAATAAETRLALLQELEQSHEGYEDAVRHVMAAAQAGELEGIHGVVGDMLEVPGKYETAVEAALGDQLQWVVCDTQEQALAAVEHLRERGLGYATFLPLASLSMVAPQAALASGDGCIGPAARVVRAAPKMGQIVEHLLGNVLLMRDLPSALRLTRRIGHQARAVTVDGTVIERSGAIRGGAISPDAGQSFGRRREQEEVARELDELRRALAATWECEERLDKAAHELTALVERTNATGSDRRAQLSELDRDLVHLRDQAQVALSAAEETAGEIGTLQQRLADTAGRREAAMRQAQEAAARAEELAGELGGEEAGAGSGEDLEARRAELVKLEVAVAELREKERSTTALVQQQQAELERLRREQGAQDEARHTLAERQGELQAELEALAGQLDISRAAADELREDVGRQSEAVAELRGKSEELDASTRKLRRILDGQQEALGRTEVSLTREQAQIEHIQERLSDVYEVTPQQAIAQLGDQEVSRNSIARQVNQFKREIRALGHVNLSAIDECERLTAREQFLSSQRDDLERARADLLAIIDEIDDAARVEFLATFEQISEAFEEIFVTLFGGGHTQLYLTDTDNPLESGVEVIAQPPGKRQRHLSLLSGGERALTALALLFGMLKVKPSPFCVLDEIDAALDEPNTDRFVGLLREFAQRSQFIVITHNPRTMEAMDLLHGITMQEAGTSQRISVKLADAQEEGRRQQAEEAARRQASGGNGDEAGADEPVAEAARS
ncbi:MAG TPA: chromosome segregation protein SMC, partial [Armatimonadota bacterium]|nr:chromosome segregation protein SMC [Armatimonadota bacterium]